MKTIAFDRQFGRDHFDCGKIPLNNYILRNVTSDVKAGACTCFVLINEKEQVEAYYTLSAEAISAEEAPDEIKKKFGYPKIPVILLGRLAVHEDRKGKGCGKFLLLDALRRSLEVAKNHIGSVAVVVDPIDEEAENFYAKYGFVKLPDSGRMFMPMRKIESLFSSKL